MVRNFRQGTSVLRMLPILGYAIWFVGCNQAYGQDTKGPLMTRAKMTLWEAIGALSTQIPFSKTKVENVLGVRLSESSRNTHTIFLQNESAVELAEGGRITEVDLRLDIKREGPGFIVLSLDGRCIGIDAVRARYRGIKITDSPRGHSLDEKTSHSISLSWGELTFGFTERNPNCLASVVLDPKRVDAPGSVR